ncbi:alpha-galactosidase [Isoptericola sediminis]|uniref:alpha-galactosidase n=1 Tax=Isoptericola sediminis TaxID=2733572 RepID=A0A849K014_9MICO|nr:alpha-galactosidase [Isoptericola sediminis]
MTSSTPGVHHLRAAGSSLVLDARGTRVPVVVHWGTDLGALDDAALEAFADAQVPAVTASAVGAPLRTTLVPTSSDGWQGSPGLSGWRPGESGSAARHPHLRHTGTTATPSSLRVGLADEAAGIEVVITLGLDEHGVLESTTSLTNTGRDDYVLDHLASSLPLPDRADEVLDLTGRWSGERRPQRAPLREGTWFRGARHGRPGHDAPTVTVVGTAGFGFRSGEVWAVHHAWSGDSALRVERLPSARTVVGAGELWGPGDVVVAPGKTYTSPRTLACWSDQGLDGVSARFHDWVRARPGRVRSPRPVTLNTWEAVYFDHDLGRLRELADLAAVTGVERFVLDDGWFRGRRDERRGLGDWTVDEDVWPAGLHPLVDHVRGLGMGFGLWIEPEMVNADSDLAREHPDWVLRGTAHRDPIPWRFQQVLDLANPDAWTHVRDALVALLEEYPIEFLKWDQNRDVLDAPSRPQVLATRRLMDELRARFPGLEIESCSSGGGRVDLDVLDRADRVWASDTNDALERQAVQRWTGLLVPPELVGSHVGADRAHTTGRVHDLELRLVTALFGHSGLETDLTRLDGDDLAAITRWTALVRELRPLVAGGRTVRADRPDEDTWVHGVVSPDAAEAAFAVVTRWSSGPAVPAPLVLPGLDPATTYRLERVELTGPPLAVGETLPPWWVAGSVTLPGSVLGSTGLPLPPLAPEQAVLLRVHATASSL